MSVNIISFCQKSVYLMHVCMSLPPCNFFYSLHLFLHQVFLLSSPHSPEIFCNPSPQSFIFLIGLQNIIFIFWFVLMLLSAHTERLIVFCKAGFCEKAPATPALINIRIMSRILHRLFIHFSILTFCFLFVLFNQTLACRYIPNVQNLLGEWKYIFFVFSCN